MHNATDFNSNGEPDKMVRGTGAHSFLPLRFQPFESPVGGARIKFMTWIRQTRDGRQATGIRNGCPCKYTIRNLGIVGVNEIGTAGVSEVGAKAERLDRHDPDFPRHQRNPQDLSSYVASPPYFLSPILVTTIIRPEKNMRSVTRHTRCYKSYFRS